MNSEHYISVDVEASGPVPGDYSLLAVGACSVLTPDKTFYRELKPITMAYEPAALRVSGFSLDRLAVDGEDPASAMSAFEFWIGEVAVDADPVMVGFNASFDWSFVNWYFVHFGRRNPFGIGAVDIKSYFMGFAGSSWKATRSSLLPTQYRPQPSQRHNALDDAVAQAQVFQTMLRDSRERSERLG